jgi:hypothetical protein
MSSRGWTWISEPEEEDLKVEVTRERIESLMSDWNRCQESLERISFRSQEEHEDMCDSLEEEADEAAYDARVRAEAAGKTEEEIEEIAEAARVKVLDRVHDRARKIHAKQQLIEEILETLGARVMRPYEHWNEDEHYMEYMENRYSDEY